MHAVGSFAATSKGLPLRTFLTWFNAAAVLLLLLGCATGPLHDASLASLSSLEAHAWQQSETLLLIDVRRAENRETDGTPAGATALPYLEGAQFVEAVLALIGHDRTRPIALICERGVISQEAQRWLRDAGFSPVYNVQDGFLGNSHGPGWKAWGLPVQRGKATGSEGQL